MALGAALSVRACALGALKSRSVHSIFAPGQLLQSSQSLTGHLHGILNQVQADLRPSKAVYGRRRRNAPFGRQTSWTVDKYHKL